jgi:hypothetical protein
MTETVATIGSYSFQEQSVDTLFLFQNYPGLLDTGIFSVDLSPGYGLELVAESQSVRYSQSNFVLEVEQFFTQTPTHFYIRRIAVYFEQLDQFGDIAVGFGSFLIANETQTTLQDIYRSISIFPNTTTYITILPSYFLTVNLPELGLKLTYNEGSYTNMDFTSLTGFNVTTSTPPVIATIYSSTNLQGESFTITTDNLNDWYDKSFFKITSNFSATISEGYKLTTGLIQIPENDSSSEREVYNYSTNSGILNSINYTILKTEGEIQTYEPISYIQISAYTQNVSLPSWKRSKLNLYDTATKSLHFHIDQNTSSTQFNFPTNLNFVDQSRNISDVIDYLERVVSIETDVDLLQGRTSVIETDINLLEDRASVNENDIDALESRASVIDVDLVVLKNRADSNASRLQVDDSELSALDAYVDALEGRVSVAEEDIETLEGRASVIETDLLVLKNRADSNASRLQVDDSELSALEAYVDILEGRMSVAEDDIDLLEGRASVNEADLSVLDSRTDSNASRLQVDDSELSALEGYVDALEGRMSTAEADIVSLENSFDVYEADVVDIKGTLYAITDGNIESMLSSLQEITDSFASETNAAEDLVELNERLTELISVVQELTEPITY